MKLIDPKQAKEFASTFFGDPILKMAANAVLDNVPTIDAAPVVHGRWERFEEISGSIGVSCSACRWKDYTHGKYKGNLFHYCPSCGAKMDGGQK